MIFIKTQNMIGKTYNELTVISTRRDVKKETTYCLCQCSCGNQKEVSASNLLYNGTKSCGCMSGKSEKCNLIRLTEDTPEFFYWLGFLLADGHFNSKGRIKVTLAIKDKEHLEKLQKFLNINTMLDLNSPIKRTIQGMDKKIVQDLMERFSIKTNKTEFPPNLNSLTKEQQVLLSIGFIDGDGCITLSPGHRVPNIRIKCHKSWLDILILLYGKGKINNQGYAETCLSSSKEVFYFKKVALEYNLPILTRKWDKIILPT